MGATTFCPQFRALSIFCREPKDDNLERELSTADRRQKREIRQLEDEIPKWQVIVEKLTTSGELGCVAGQGGGRKSGGQLIVHIPPPVSRLCSRAGGGLSRSLPVSRDLLCLKGVCSAWFRRLIDQCSACSRRVTATLWERFGVVSAPDRSMFGK